MAKPDRDRKQSSRARIAAQQEAARRAEARRRALLAGGVVAVVVLVVLGIVLGKVLGGSSPAFTGPATEQLPASVQSKIMTVPPSTLAAVGTGTAESGSFTAGSGPRLVSGGKPEMLYIGAEWCPYCAAERWAMAVALSRFGTFSPLRGIHSSTSDVYPGTATLTFYKATYTSPYLVFTPVENQTVNHGPLQQPTAAQLALWTHYLGGTSYPFIDIGNLVVATSTYNPQVLHGLTWSQIAADLHDPSSQVAKGAVGSANIFTAAICKLTGNKPANVCTTQPVSSLEGRI